MIKSRYQANSNYSHGSLAPLGILLTNLGTPAAPTPAALRSYLREFLSDPRVVEIPKPLWWFILNGFILPFRPKRSAKIYQKIWTAQGSPLLTHMQQLTTKLEQQLALTLARPIKIALGMRYGNPSIAEGLTQLRQANARQILLLPLYPQYASATTGSSFDAISNSLKTWRFVPEIRFINQYADFAPYIEVLANRIRQHWQTQGQRNHLLFSFHGIPKRSQLAGDPYYCYCHKTARLVTEKLELAVEDWSLVFQSRFGKAEWLQPYCDKTLAQLPSKGITEVDMICPGFAVDCLETLEEIDMQNRNLFLAAGGKKFHYIPALNAQDDHIEVIAQLIQDNLQNW